MTKLEWQSPGKILRDEFLSPFALSVSAAALAMGMPRSRLNQIVRGERGITADSALRLSRYFGNSAEFWLNLQNHYDLMQSMPRVKKSLTKIKPLPRPDFVTSTQA
jgi:antitoxin HigA-1